MNKNMVLDFTKQTMIATIYVVLVYAFQFLSFEQLQFRIAEVLLILVFFDKKSVIGLLLGTFIANWLLSPFGLVDAVFGTLATAVGVSLMIRFRRYRLVALIFPAISNGLIIGWMISYIDQIPFLPIFFFIFIGEAIVLYILGLPIYHVLKDHPFFIEVFRD